MGAGRKRHKITIQRLESMKNDYGERIDTWVDDVSIWAAVEPLRGNEYFKGSEIPQKIAQVDTRMRIRARTGLDPGTNRIMHKGIVYDLVSVLFDNRQKEIQLMVKASEIEQAPEGSVNP